MATLKQIKGTAIQFLDTDPVVYAGAWSSSGALNTARTGGGLAGSLTAGLYFGGNTPPSSQITETYNGTSWSEVNDMTETARDQMYGFGTQTAAISAAGVTGATGNKSKLVESWDGTSWTAGTDNNTARQAGGSAGKSQTAGLIYGGKDGSGPGNTDNADTESWNGSAWTELNNLNTAGAYMAGGGTQTSALCSVGGNRPAQNESWNGTSWSEISEQNTYRDQSGGSADSNVSGLIYAGEAPPVTAITESWDGTTWTEVADMGTARSIGSGGTGGQSGGASSALGVGGQIAPGARTGLTEEWSFPPATASALQEGDMWFNSSSSTLKGYAKSTPSGSWSSGGSLNTARAAAGASSGSDGNTSLFIISGGTPNSVNVEEYDGSAFTEIANVNNAGENGMSSGNGSTVATIFTGGNPPRAALTESWNGSSWTEVNDLNTGRGQAAGIGTQTAALVAGQAYGAIVESWDGTSWTEVSDLNTGRGNLAGMGSQTLAITAGGRSPSSPAIMGNVETWNGSSWTETTDLNTARAETSGSGVPYNNVIVIGGEPSKANTEFWNGSTWTEVGDMATAGSRISQNMGASANATLAFLQASPSVTTEEWTADSAVVTVTTS